MASILGDLTSDLINIVYKESKKKNNIKKLHHIIDLVIDYSYSKIQPFLYTIIGVLIIMFIMNCLQFYYYIKMYLQNNNGLMLSNILTEVN